MNTIDWNKPLRMMGATGPRDELVRVSVSDETGDCNKIIKYYHSNGSGPFYTVVSEDSGVSFEPYGYSVENVPVPEVSESPENCLLLIRCVDGEWFFHCGHTPEHGREDFALPKTREEVEDWALDFGDDCLIVEVPERK